MKCPMCRWREIDVHGRGDSPEFLCPQCRSIAYRLERADLGAPQRDLTRPGKPWRSAS
jgi:hypothetical protein